MNSLSTKCLIITVTLVKIERDKLNRKVLYRFAIMTINIEKLINKDSQINVREETSQRF